MAAALAAGLGCAVPDVARAEDQLADLPGALPDAPVAPQTVPDFGFAAELPPLHVTLASLPLLSDEIAEISELAPALSLLPAPRPWGEMPVLRWDDHPRGDRWTLAVMHALRTHGARLTEVVPADIDVWCPGYQAGDAHVRASFWAGLVSALAWHESTHRPDAVGGGGLWYGLVQILPSTARLHGCEATTGAALLNGPANLRCGIRIMARTVARDGVVSRNMRGVAADWGPFHSTRKREDMMRWVSSQDFCRLPPAPIRPVPRPDAIQALAEAANAPPRPTPRPDGFAATVAEIVSLREDDAGVTRSGQDE